MYVDHEREAHTMVHVYRDEPVPRKRSDDLFGLAFGAFSLAWVGIPVVHGIRHGFTGDDIGAIAVFLFIGGLVGWAFYSYAWRDCAAIHLSDDGTCELVTRRRLIRLHVNEIRAVTYKRDDEGFESYSVRYTRGRIGLRSSIADLPDFLTRLQALNPAVDLKGFPDRRLEPLPPRRPARWAGAVFARWPRAMVLIGIGGCVVCVLVLFGLAIGLLPDRYSWLFLVGMAAAFCFVYAFSAGMHSLGSGGPSTTHACGAWSQPVELKLKPNGWLVYGITGLIVAPIVALVIVAITMTEPGDRYPNAKNATSTSMFTRPLAIKTSGVWLVPLGEPRSQDITELALELAARYRLPVAVLPDIALPPWTLDAKKHSLVGDNLLRLLGQAYGAEGQTAIIGITDYEMYGGTEFRDSVFSWRQTYGNYAVVSTSPLGAGVSDLLWHGHTRHVRTRKLIARNIGFLYLRRPEVDDSHSLLRSSMHGVHDIDKLTEAL